MPGAERRETEKEEHGRANSFSVASVGKAPNVIGGHPPQVPWSDLLQGGACCHSLACIADLQQRTQESCSSAVNGEIGRIRFRGVRFQTPNSVSFFGLAEFRGANSVSSSQPIICVQTWTHRVSRRTHRVCPKTQWGSVSSLLRNSTLETVFRPSPSEQGNLALVIVL